MTIRDAGFLRKLPDDDDLYMTIDGTMAVLLGVDIPRLLSGTTRHIFVNQHQVGTIRCHPRPGHEDLITVRLHNLTFTIWRDQFERVWSGRQKYTKIVERIPDCWIDLFAAPEVTA